MPKINRRVIVPLLVVFAVLVLFMPRTAKFNYDYRKGSPWPYETLISQFDFPILKTEEQLMSEMEEAGASTIPYYRFSEEVVGNTMKALQSLDLGRYNSLRPTLVNRMNDIYGKGVISDAKIKLDRGYAQVSNDVIFIQKNKRATKYPRSEVYRVSDAQTQLVSQMSRTYPDVNLDSLFRRSGVYDLIAPNLIFDKTMTELGHANSADFVSPTSGYVNADQKIVSKGEIVTPEIAQILDSYKAEYNKIFGYDGPRILLWLGDMLIALAIVVILFFCIFYTNRLIFEDRNRYYYLLTVFLITAVASFLIERLSPSLVYLMPFSISALYLLAFFKKRVVMPAYMVSLLPLLVFSGNGVELFVIFLTAGVVSMRTFKFFSKGWLQFVNALIIFLVELLVFTGFRLIDAGRSLVWMNLLMLFGGAVLTVAMYPLIYLFERVFNLVSPTKLIEMTDTNNPLLQELAQNAPGTFQHCLQVMNMVDAAGRAVHANVPLLRAGALYHDLGKMKNPNCFIENESSNPGLTRYHDGKDPRDSARDIIRHVADGMAIAEEHKLPGQVSEFILTHHGTSATGYFLNQYLNAGGDPSDVADFYYPGRKPQTKEQVILMICDSVEAASRTLKDFSPEALDHFVEGIVAGKEKMGQLEESEITVHELFVVKAVLKTYLQQIYHERVEYPQRRDA